MLTPASAMRPGQPGQFTRAMGEVGGEDHVLFAAECRLLEHPASRGGIVDDEADRALAVVPVGGERLDVDPEPGECLGQGGEPARAVLHLDLELGHVGDSTPPQASRDRDRRFGAPRGA